MAFTPIKGAELEDFHGDASITTSRAPDAFITHYCHLTYLERHELRDLLFPRHNKGKKTVITFLYMDADGEFHDSPEHVTFKPPGFTREDAYMRSIKEYDKSKASRAYQYNLEAIVDTARKRIVKYANDGVMEGRLPVYTGHRVPTRVGTDPILPKIESGDACWET
ncbi:hypothetical protein FAGAP_1070 [Fusarium agapanthi]|uniref:Uncharacterized protein n=1 Tax=Fusarium agapanthi TaxID=1803897 RepID=A0A9P5EBF2_9HYPO|nr:hypothetical protein FAGAP_1070 [Fusarium agapanthi]